MLAQNFLTAKELHCTDADLDAAIRVLGMLERAELVGTIKPGENSFHMGIWWSENSRCGTVGCIGGWMEHVKGDSLSKECLSPRWGDIFCPDGWVGHAKNFTVERCAKALRAKLTIGKADWSIDPVH